MNRESAPFPSPPADAAPLPKSRRSQPQQPPPPPQSQSQQSPQSPELLTASQRIHATARLIAPILNRVVLAGPPVVELLMNDPAVELPQLRFAEDQTLHLLTTAMLERLGAELLQLGFSRIGRSAGSERWSLSPEIALELFQVRADDDDPEQLWLEYETLLTQAYQSDGETSLRVAGAPAVIARECFLFERSGCRLNESAEMERVILLIAARVELERECAAAPSELRGFISTALARVLRHDALPALIRRTIPDAVLLPTLVTRIKERLARLST